VVSFEVIVITNQEVKEKSDLLSICSNWLLSFICICSLGYLHCRPH
jgi:hypothetical protein